MIYRKTIIRVLIVVVLLFNGMGTSHGQMNRHSEDTLGVVNFSISCLPGSQNQFNHAVILLHHMTYPQAREAFQRIAQQDSGCAMAYWGIAMTLFQPVWPTRPGPADLQRGWEVIQKAITLNPPTLREQLLIDATAAFFREPESGDYWRRIRSWADGMEKCYAAFPDDDEALHFTH